MSNIPLCNKSGLNRLICLPSTPQVVDMSQARQTIIENGKDITNVGKRFKKK
jgi:hypothetical protein